jgi:hypothetical protein
LLEPGNVLDPGVFTDKKRGKNLAHLGPPAAAVVVLRREGIIEVRHVGKVKKRVQGVKADRGCVS